MSQEIFIRDQRMIQFCLINCILLTLLSTKLYLLYLRTTCYIQCSACSAVALFSLKYLNYLYLVSTYFVGYRFKLHVHPSMLSLMHWSPRQEDQNSKLLTDPCCRNDDDDNDNSAGVRSRHNWDRSLLVSAGSRLGAVLGLATYSATLLAVFVGRWIDGNLL